MDDYIVVVVGYVAVGLVFMMITGRGIELLLGYLLAIVSQGVYELYGCIEVTYLQSGTCTTLASFDDDLMVMMGAVLGVFILLEVPRALFKYWVRPNREVM